MTSARYNEYPFTLRAFGLEIKAHRCLEIQLTRGMRLIRCLVDKTLKCFICWSNTSYLSLLLIGRGRTAEGGYEPLWLQPVTFSNLSALDENIFS